LPLSAQTFLLSWGSSLVGGYCHDPSIFPLKTNPAPLQPTLHHRDLLYTITTCRLCRPHTCRHYCQSTTITTSCHHLKLPPHCQNPYSAPETPTMALPPRPEHLTAATTLPQRPEHSRCSLKCLLRHHHTPAAPLPRHHHVLAAPPAMSPLHLCTTLMILRRPYHDPPSPSYVVNAQLQLL
jgi:hypothetical protein